MAINHDDEIRCDGCGQFHRRKGMTGIGYGPPNLRWYCPGCVINGPVDLMFARLGKAVRAQVTALAKSTESEGK